MVKFILGTAQSGKTYNLISRIGELVKGGEDNILLLVPEQASFECERELLKTLGTKNANSVNVVSFTRLCSTILSELGGIGARVADDGTRLILLSQALHSLKDDLEVYGNYSGLGFASKLIKDISELKQAAITPEILISCAEKVTNRSLRLKLHDIAAIMSAYDSMLSGRFIDPEDIATLCARKASESAWFKGKHLFIDGFTGFTHSQYLLLETAIRHSQDVTFSFTSDGDLKTSDTELFANIKNEISHIKAIAGKYGVSVDKPLLLTTSRAKAVELCSLEELLRGRKTNAPASVDNIRLVACMTPRDELEYIANCICREVRKNGRRWRDFVIITGKDANLEQTVSTVMKRYEIPCFVSSNKLLCDLPIARFIIASISAANGGYKTEDILAYLKSGLADMDDEGINKLENYVYLWSINGKKWLDNWDMSPYGIEEKSIDTEIINKELVELNELRLRAIIPLQKLANSLKGTAANMVRGVYNFLENCKTAQKIREYTAVLEGQGEYSAAALQSISWDKLISVLDRVTGCILDSELTATRFGEILATSFAAETVGEIPQRTDEVIFGTADRLRPLRPAVVFVVGANIGIFPAGISNSGIFTLAERNELQRLDAPLPDRYLAAATEQNYLFYTAVCSASERVYITYSRTNGEAALKPNAQVSKIRKSFGFCDEDKQKVFSFDKNDTADFERPWAAFSYLAMHSLCTDETTASIRDALNQLPEYSNKLGIIDSAKQKDSYISSETAQKLYGDNLYLSASKLENYYSCPFSYFCRYGLAASLKRKASLDSMVRGTVAHYVFESVLKKYQGNYAALDEQTAFKEANEAIDKYFAKIGADKNNLDAASRYALSCVSELICQVITFIAKDFAENEFSPAAFELDVSYKGQASPLRVEADNCTVNITGKIDRVDTSPIADGTAVRIVDYKSSAKAFNLAHVLEGRNMQMLIYLCAVIESSIKLFDSPKPAGIMYLQALPGVKQDEFSLKPSAFLTDDVEALSRMDKEMSGEFIPVKLTKSGVVDKRSPVVSYEDFDIIFKFIKTKIAQMANQLRLGRVAADPIEVGKTSGCKYCDFRAVCGREKQESVRVSEYEKLSRDEVLEIMKEEVSN